MHYVSLFVRNIYQEGSGKKERSGLGIEIGGVKIPALVFADDIVLCVRSEIELSHLLGIIWQELVKLGLEINGGTVGNDRARGGEEWGRSVG